MPDRADDVRREGVAPRGVPPRRPPEQWLFSGTDGLVLASAMISALDATGEKADPGSDALWVLLTAPASSAAHGYAHVMCDLFALSTIEADRAWFMEHGRLTVHRSKAISREVNGLCRKIRPLTVDLVDAWGIPPEMLRAPDLVG